MPANRYFAGVVRPGLARGRKLGFPTANLEVNDREVESLERGVFAGVVQWEGESEYGALINIGVRPTFAEGGLSIELHLLDFTGDLYGKFLQVTIIERLRDERRFGNVEALIEQIKSDVKHARTVLEDRTVRSN